MPRQEQKNLVGQKAPLFSAKTAEGETILLDELQGNVVLLDFWATWCPHCVRTCPDIQGIADAFADKPVVVLGINRDRPGTEERVEQFVSRNGLTFDQIYDFDRMIARRFDVGTIPSTVIIDADGIIRVFHSGVPDDQVRVLTDSITELLAEIESP